MPVHMSHGSRVAGGHGQANTGVATPPAKKATEHLRFVTGAQTIHSTGHAQIAWGATKHVQGSTWLPWHVLTTAIYFNTFQGQSGTT
jgi:hypothetical protein